MIKDRKDTSEYTVAPGKRIQLVANNTFEFLIGKADGLRLKLNGKKLGALGKSGECVKYMLVDSTGIKTKRLTLPVLMKAKN